jgi:hypothetical protein
MPVLLGAAIYHDENISGMEGLGQLGEPVTLSSIAAAAGVVAGIVGMIKEVGNIFKKKGAKGAEDFDPAANEAADKAAPAPLPVPNAATPPFVNTDDNGGAYPAAFPAPAPVPPAYAPAANDNGNNLVKTGTGADSYAPPAEKGFAPSNESPAVKETAEPATNTAADSNTGGGNSGEPPKTSFWDKNKTWLKPVGIGVGTLTVIGLAYAAMRNKEAPAGTKRTVGRNGTLSGLPGKKKNHRRGTGKKKYSKQYSIGLS